MVRQHDERREIVIQRTQPVTDPTSRARKTRQLKARRLQQRPGTVYARFADKVVDEGKVIDHRAERRNHFAEHFAALAIGLKIPDRLEPRPESVLKRLDVPAKIALLPVAFHQLRFLIE